MRTIWKGHIQFSLVNIPVRLYTAVDSGQSIHFAWLTEDEHHHVGYVKTDKETGETLDKDEIVKGYEYESDKYVIISEEDIEKAEPESTHVIKIEGFINEEETHPMLYDKPYFLGPDDKSAIETYRLFTRTLKETAKMAVGRFVLREKESPVLLTAHENGILMYKLRYPDQVRSMKDVPNVGKNEKIDENQLEMAKELVEKMVTNFEDLDIKDHYYKTMKKMVEDKVEGKEVVNVEEHEPEARDIMAALKESINAAGNGKDKSNGHSRKYKELTKDELYEKATKADIEGRSKMNKGELIKALKD